MGKFSGRQTEYFSYFSQKTGFDISCEIMFPEKNNVSKCSVLKIFPRGVSVEAAFKIAAEEVQKCFYFSVKR